jgi:hypothetical protein
MRIARLGQINKEKPAVVISDTEAVFVDDLVADFNRIELENGAIAKLTKTDLSSRDNYARRHKTIWNLRVPSDRVLDVNQNIFDNLNLSAVRPRLTRRLKDKWFMVELTYNNTPNNKLVVHSAKATYALNSR